MSLYKKKGIGATVTRISCEEGKGVLEMPKTEGK